MGDVSATVWQELEVRDDLYLYSSIRIRCPLVGGVDTKCRGKGRHFLQLFLRRGYLLYGNTYVIEELNPVRLFP